MENSQSNYSQNRPTDAIVTLEGYLDKVGNEGSFEIPNYQRGYIWGQKRADRGKDSVTYLTETLVNGYKLDRKDLFLQGVTVYEKESNVIVVDGQQRTVFFYLLLKWLGYDNPPKISYAIREESNKFLEEVDAAHCDPPSEDEEFQDLYFFKKSLQIFNSMFDNDKEINKVKFLEYILRHVKFLYITIPEDKAMLIFSMMNGNKALMQDFELIKADLLRRASMGTGGYDAEASEWDNISLRSRYAHEWDAWLHWWNQRDVQLMYDCENPMGWLLKTILKTEDNLYDVFRKYIDEDVQGKSEAQKAKFMFAHLRLIQKRFEEVFSDPIQHNHFGLIIRLLEKKQIVSFMYDYFNRDIPALKDMEMVYNLLFFRLDYNDIREGKGEKFNGNAELCRKKLVEEPIYKDKDYKELAYSYLLIRNVERENALKRWFDFSSWKGNRSLEHVYPQSKVVHKKNDDYWYNGWDKRESQLDGWNYDDIDKVWRNQDGEKVKDDYGYILRGSIQSEELNREGIIVTEHSIGNLLLLYGKDNSAFGNKMPEEKRTYYFDPGKDILPSRNLLHTIFSFGRFEHFRGPEICENHLEAKRDIEKRIEKVSYLLKNRAL